jgi:hypothetical protein
MGNGHLVCVRGRRNAYCILIGMSERKSEDPGSFDVGGGQYYYGV